LVLMTASCVCPVALYRVLTSVFFFEMQELGLVSIFWAEIVLSFPGMEQNHE
jgi:hypothetical protein